MALTRRHQAVHDSLTGTTVQIRDLTRARASDVAIERPVAPAVRVAGRIRRLVVVLAYLVAAFVTMAVLMGIVLAPACLDEIACTPGEELAKNAVAIAWLSGSVFLIITGWRGKLWGTRATPAPTDPAPSSQPTPLRLAVRRTAERLAAMPPHHLGGLYVATLTLTALVQHFVPVLWLPLAALEIAAFLILFATAALFGTTRTCSSPGSS